MQSNVFCRCLYEGTLNMGKWVFNEAIQIEGFLIGASYAFEAKTNISFGVHQPPYVHQECIHTLGFSP